MKPPCPRHCPMCGHRTMGAGDATMQCSRCKAWDWLRMDRTTTQYVRTMLAKQRAKERKAA